MDNNECIFNPDYKEPKERVSLTLDPLNVRNIKKMRGQGFNMSDFVNGLLKAVFSAENRLKPHEYSHKLKEYKKVDLLVHIEVARLLERLISMHGAYRVARKLSYLIGDDSDMKRADLDIYGAFDLYDKSMGRLKSLNDAN